MRISLVGYGKMGKVIERVALDRGHEIAYKIDVANRADIEKISPENTDVAIEFSSPESAFENLKKCMQKGVKTVSGTTGWLERKTEIEALCKENGTVFFYASNFSIGVNLFFQLNKQLAKLMNTQKVYGVSTSEIHHTEKLDTPSGTAITLAEGIVGNLEHKDTWVNQKIAQTNEVPIWSIREGRVPGTHSVKYISEVDEIEIRHEAKSREGFALGAVIAAEWVLGKEGVLGMDDLLQI